MATPESTKGPRVPTTGMRGGLGRTLLTAFLLLAIVPLSAISWYATRRERRDLRREVIAKLSSVAVLTESQIQCWGEGHLEHLALLAAVPGVRQQASTLLEANAPAEAGSEGDEARARDSLRQHLSALLDQDTAFRCVALLDDQGRTLVATDPSLEGEVETSIPALTPDETTIFRMITLEPEASVGAVVAKEIGGPDGVDEGVLVGWLDLDDLAQELGTAQALGSDSRVYLVDEDGIALPQGEVVSSEGIEAALDGERVAGLYDDYAGDPVIGVYQWMPALELALVAEQKQETAFAPADNVAAAIIGATLLVALGTAVVAAVVTRQITRPVVRLTESALSVAEGELDQQVPVTSRDEIGILTYVFNKMTADLKSLYDDLEAKVAQRTEMLQRANYQIQRRAIQLAATVEVSQAATSILEPSKLLHEVVRLIHDRFDYCYVGVYLLDESGEQAFLREGTGGGERVKELKAAPVPLGEGSAVGEAGLKGEPRIVRWGSDRADGLFGSPYIQVEAALPLKLGDETVGVLDILDTESEEMDEDAISVLRNVANQITIALENARIYRKEKETARRLREAERFRSRFLGHMSHELREPLTNIIGFSRLMLKGLDGDLNDQQRKDVKIIHANSQHLLGLINDLLDISQIEAGLMELHFQDLDLSEMINSVMSTASALVRDKEIDLLQEIEPDLPIVQADVTRIRQVLLKLLTNAANFTDQGSITVRAWSEDGRVLVSVSDTGRGIPLEDQERIFERFEQGQLGDGRRPDGAGLGLALSKEFVAMHGGKIWVESEVGVGSTFTFSLPVETRSERGEALDGARVGEEER